MENVAKFASVLLNSREQTHIFHLQATSYAVHMALGGYYDAIGGLVDGYVENYQGIYGILKGYVPSKSFFEDDDALKYMEELSKFVKDNRDELPEDTELNNTVDEILTLIHSTIYKLKFLK